MPFSINYLSALINETYGKVIVDNVFTKDHYLTKVLMDRAETFNGKTIHTALEYGENDQIQETGRGDTISYAFTDTETAARYGNKMLTGTISLPLEDTLEDMNKDAIVKMMKHKSKNAEKSLKKYFAGVLWERVNASTGALPRTKMWNNLDYFVNNLDEAVGGVEDTDTSAAPSWWKSPILKSTSFTGNITLEADLVDPTKDTYLPKIFARMSAKSQFRDGDKIIMLPQYLWDLYEGILDEKRTGDKFSTRVGNAGFNALKWRGEEFAVIGSNDASRAQSSDTDGRIYMLNLDYLYMYFNSNAKFKVGEFKELENINAYGAKTHVFGNLACSNRASQVAVHGIYSPTDYSI